MWLCCRVLPGAIVGANVRWRAGWQQAVTAEGLYRAALDKLAAAPVLLPYQRRDKKFVRGAAVPLGVCL